MTLSHPGPCAAVAKERGCPTMCPLIWKQVCGSDGVTYDSECRYTISLTDNGIIFPFTSFIIYMYRNCEFALI